MNAYTVAYMPILFPTWLPAFCTYITGSLLPMNWVLEERLYHDYCTIVTCVNWRLNPNQVTVFPTVHVVACNNTLAFRTGWSQLGFLRRTDCLWQLGQLPLFDASCWNDGQWRGHQCPLSRWRCEDGEEKGCR